MIITIKKTAATILVILLSLSNLYAAKSDSTRIKRDSTRVQYFTGNFEKFGILKTITTDTSLAGVQNSDPLYKKSRFFASLGNAGSPHLSLLPFSDFTTSGFDYGIHSYDQYIYKNDSVRYYRILKTYTDLEYSQGAKKELMFHAIFSRNIYRSLNLGFEFRALSSVGAYVRQRTNHINFVLTSQFFSKNRRYAAIANLRINLLRNQENGGIKTDSIFEQNLETNRQVIPVNLTQAQNRVKDNGFFMKHYFNLSRHGSAIFDSTGKSKKYFELGRLTYTFSYNRQIFHYSDNNLRENFYQNFYYDTVRTDDSVNINRFTNILSWTNPSFKPDKNNRLLQFEFSLKQEYIEVYDKNVKRYFNQLIPFGEISFQPYYGFTLKGYADFVTGTYNGGDFSFRASLSQLLGGEKKNAGSLGIFAYYALQKPGWFLQNYSGNNFVWDNAWNQQGIISGGGSYSFRNFAEAGVVISRISNFVYLDTAATPKQYQPQFGFMRIYLNAKLPLGKFDIRGKFNYQTVQGTNVLRVPVFLGNLDFYFNQPLFHGAAIFQPGLTLNYNSLYYGNAYMPAISSFYLQDKKQIGDYLYMDIFINLKVQRARIFFMYSHFNASLMGYHYYTTLHYPMQDAAFRFGLTWRFFD